MSTLFGLSNYESPFSLWEQKTGKVPLDPPVDERTAELREWGNRLEPAIRQASADRLGITIDKPDITYHHPDRMWQRANLDGWTEDGRIFEAKNTDSRNRDQWAGQIPDHAELQVHHAAIITGAEHAIVAGLIGGNHLELHEITINPTVLDIIQEAEESFWKHVESDTPPPRDGHIATMRALTREWAHHPGDKEVPATEVQDLWEAWRQAADDEKAAELRKKTALAGITSLMDGHDSLRSGRRVWASAQRGQLDLKRLAVDHSDLVGKFTKPAPKFNLAEFKAEHPDLYRSYQQVSIRPKTPKEN